MSENVQSALLEILMKIQDDTGGVKTDVASLKGDVSETKGRLECIETTSRKQERYNAGLLVMMQATVGRFVERVSSLETEILRLKEVE
jgi:hypothetical protein